ncbi:hypothetical protein GOP47_0011431 [Adiantum capillus-veneris]|uniref:Fe2OG dioxygenase domain-containing protein n=1 Tax=Adiantum capillus-veneris TaxID=13818 RepID=A0A9D4ZFE3_ADICA|nr:hypothetical protein GOP47_0011431 [Adiantum capillus-veneris]
MAAVDAPVCVDELSVRDISVILSGLSNDVVIPERFMVKEALRPSLSLLPSSDLPVIDLAPMLASPHGSAGGRADVVSALTRAAKEWGFFQVVNHGVPIELLERMASSGHDFFCLPTEQKEKGAGSNFLDGYAGKSRMVKDVGCMWLEGITLRSILAEPSAEQFANRVWPSGNPTFCDAVSEVGRELEALKNSILGLLAEGLGLPTDFFTRPFEELKAAGQPNAGADLRLNFYPACAQPSLALGTMAHTDPTLMTLLYQDTGYGLQILGKDGSSWHLVDYKRDGIIIFVNDVLQGWSNGVLQAGIHRVVLNRDRHRLSFLLSSRPPSELLIQPACTMDGEYCPPRYRPFTFGEYIAATSEYGHLPPENGRKGIDIYAGISS